MVHVDEVCLIILYSKEGFWEKHPSCATNKQQAANFVGFQVCLIKSQFHSVVLYNYLLFVVGCCLWFFPLGGSSWVNNKKQITISHCVYCSINR
mmetsp:Transcript_45094/g.78015  ORF Transcript_45094/g.78015 Transcript_45094/m.78015 type:complete len:94 (+) Transcript_45094:1288-1569(+)